MDLLVNILAVIGGFYVAASAAVLFVLFVLLPEREQRSPNHPEKQDEFTASINRWSDVQERKGQ